jgi:hypothetical protein
MFALISTIDAEQPYRFCETAEVVFPVTEPALFWVPCPDDVSPITHTWDGTQFVLIPVVDLVMPAKSPSQDPTVI